MALDPNNVNIIWAPIPRSSQVFAIDTRADETLYTGTRGPGKTDVQLMRFRRNVGLGYGAFWRGIIFDREYKNLDDLVAKSKRWFPRFEDGARFLSSKSDYRWVWPTGEELLFRAIKDPNDYWNYHGQEFPFIGWNELTKYPTSELYDLMLSCNRVSFTPKRDTPLKRNSSNVPIRDDDGNYVYNTVDGLPLPDIKLEVFSTTNSYGPGHLWVKQRFITPAPYGKLVKKTTTIFNPRTQVEEERTSSRVSIFGNYKENIYLHPSYVERLLSISDPNIRASWEQGSWDIISGGALDDVWAPNVHIVPRFYIPKGWRIDRAFDWGSTHPFWVGWFAEADGTEATLPNGQVFCPPKGSLVLFNEWYGTHEIGTNAGIRMSAKDVAKGIVAREKFLRDNGIIQTKVQAGPADNQIRNVHDADTPTIEKRMQDEGVYWEPSDKSPGSRIQGLELVRGAFLNSKENDGPGLYLTDNCQVSITLLPLLPRDEANPDDVDTTAEDHPYDGLRYRILKAAKTFASSFKLRQIA